MMKERYGKDAVAETVGKSIFFDANVLLYIFWPTGTLWENKYASIFSLLLKQKNQLVVDFIVISEVVNRAMRIEYEKHIEKEGLTKKDYSFKKYRNSKDGQEALRTAYIIVKNYILNYFFVDAKLYTKADIESYLFVNSLDFNDKSIVSLCQEKEYILFTNDRDYAECDLEILSANPALSTLKRL